MAPPRLQLAQRLEDGPVAGRTLLAFTLPGQDPSGFTDFLDGTQRTLTAFYLGMTPVVFAHLGAVIRHRRERHMTTWRVATRQALYAPLHRLTPQERAALDRAVGPHGLRDTFDGGEEIAHPSALLELARNAVNEDRATMERELAETWVREVGMDENRWLFLDGSLGDSHLLARFPRAVGVIKSHQTHYFQVEDQQAVMEMKRAQRSALFKPFRHTEVCSWYLRLREPEGHPPTFGLVRVEMENTKQALDRVDTVSTWLLAETAPLSLPDSRWDRMIYPIRDCEQYLKSLAPSPAALEAAFFG